MSTLFAQEAKEIVLRPYQEDAIEALRENIRRGIKRQILCAGTGAGKCLGRGTPILMADGTIKPVEKVEVGDRLAGPYGPNTVLSLARGREQMFRITPTKGDAYTCNASHLLSLKKSGTNKLSLSDGTIVSPDQEHVVCRVDTLYHSNGKAQHCLKGWRSAIAEFDGSAVDLPMPAYVFGAWLGDGSKRMDTCAITKPEGPVVDAWLAWAESLGCGVRRSDSNGERCPSWHTVGCDGQRNPCLDALRSTGVEPSICAIPHAYKTSAWDHRAELLAGLLDTDGSVSRGGWDYISKHRSLSEDVAFLARSLGLAAYVSECTKGIKETGFSGTYWRVSISGDASIVPCRAKQPPPRRINKDPLRHGITITPIGEGEYFGFEISGDRLFMLGDFTVTHNTVMASHLLKQADRKGSYGLFLVDRIALVNQTSATLDDYGIRHGVLQGINDRYAPRENVQVCSAQTLARRALPRDPDLIIVDEAHCQYKAVLDLMARYPNAIKIGLTATPFTKGMGNHWDGMVNVIPTRQLIEQGYLIQPKMFVAKSPEDSELGLNSFGEFSDESAASAGIRIIGDVVSEWISKAHEHFGGPAKTIVFSPTVDHGRELCAAFAAAGYNFQQISYLDKSDDERAAKIEEFRRADSMIHGLVSCGVLTKGFDVPDTLIGISCKPYRKSLSSHMQEIGRVMRSSPGKSTALWLDHSGNLERFARDMFDVWDNGPGELDKAEKRDSEKRERNEQIREKVVCPECSGALRGNTCTACGWERPARSSITAVEGSLHEFSLERLSMQPRAGLRADCLKDPRVVWQAALAYCAMSTSKGEEMARKWAYGVVFGSSGIYPGSKPPRGWYDMPIPASYDQHAYSLVERETKRFRKNNRRKAA